LILLLAIVSAIRTSQNLRFAIGRKKDSSLFLDCFRHVIIHEQYWNKWISDQCWINLINEHFEIPESLQFTKTNLNTALSRNKMYDGIDILTTANAFGLYKSSNRPGKIRITGYYVTTPFGNARWKLKVV
jgi:hypothetical protein